MSAGSLVSLDWLERPPAELRQRIRALGTGEEKVPAADLAALARTALNLDQLISLARAVERLGDRIDTAGLSRVKLALMLDGTADFLPQALRVTGLRHGLWIDVYTPPYGQAMNEAMGQGGLAAFAPDVALVGSDYRSLGLATPRMNPSAAQASVDAAVTRLSALTDALSKSGVVPLIQTIPEPVDSWCGHLDAGLPGAPAAQVAKVNAVLREQAQKQGAPVLDADRLAASVGRAEWIDTANWYRAKLPFALSVVPLWADHVVRILAALRGRSRKCLVLDLDNTCWGGIIGDDGVEGIRLGQGSADGEAYLAIQSYALSLRDRGVVLAVVSKNEEDAALLPFRNHPEMLLKEDDIAVFIANWTDKATNIAHVAKRLNIGLDALVFLDDNPAERARVRQMLPDVAVPEVPDDPSQYPMLLAQSGLFETIALSADDAKRAEQYRQNAARAVAMEKIGDYDSYLASLEMTCELAPFDAVGRARIAQLVNKSNQFNLTTRRYTEADIARFEAAPDVFDLQVRLRDSFGDNGMISVVVFRKGDEEWICDTWLMSCRVLGRRVEEAVLAEVAKAARAEGVCRLVGEYLPSAKNRMVAGHFEKLGFRPAGASGTAGPEGPGTRWVLDLDGYAVPDLPMRIVPRTEQQSMVTAT